MKKKTARAHYKTPETSGMVAALASHGLPLDNIAAYLGIAKPTLVKWYWKEIRSASTETNARVGEFLKNAATGDALDLYHGKADYSDCLRAAMFWAKTRMGYKETQGIDHTSTDGTMSPKAVDSELVSALVSKLID